LGHLFASSSRGFALAASNSIENDRSPRLFDLAGPKPKLVANLKEYPANGAYIGQLEFSPGEKWSFARTDEGRFRALGLARQAMQEGGMAPAVLNAANEVAVEAFLTGRLGFLQIAQLVAETLEMADGRGLLGEATDLTGVLATDASARQLALNLLGMTGTCELPPAH
jgi:1-deoxy-D-xylulose 5-phosphate reductoisomerase